MQEVQDIGPLLGTPLTWRDSFIFLAIFSPVIASGAVVMYYCVREAKQNIPRWSRLRTAVFLFFGGPTREHVRSWLLKGGDRIDDAELQVFRKLQLEYFVLLGLVQISTFLVLCVPLAWLISMN